MSCGEGGPRPRHSSGFLEVVAENALGHAYQVAPGALPEIGAVDRPLGMGPEIVRVIGGQPRKCATSVGNPTTGYWSAEIVVSCHLNLIGRGAGACGP